MFINPLLLADAYKLSHFEQYPKRPKLVYSNLTPRSSKHFPVKTDKVLVFGVYPALMHLIDIWNDNFFSDDIEFDYIYQEYEDLITSGVNGTKYFHSSITKEMWKELHEFGKLPIDFKTIEEGTIVDIGTPILSINNTDPRFWWLVGFLETQLSATLWKPITVATVALNYYKKVYGHLLKTTSVDVRETAAGQVCDFSARGMSNVYDIVTSGLSHLAVFNSTDNLLATQAAKDHYYVDEDYLYGCSIAATEHSVMCQLGKDGHEEVMKRVIDLYRGQPCSIVIDGYDYWKALGSLKDLVPEEERFSRDRGLICIRPDSGDVLKILFGDPEKEGWEGKGTLETLAEFGGYRINEKGYKELSGCFSIFYGDGVSLNNIDLILQGMEERGWSIKNTLYFGAGSYSYQYLSRDTLGFAIKTTWMETEDGEELSIQKDPITDPIKKSRKGLFNLVRGEDNKIKVIETSSYEEYQSRQNDDLMFSIIYEGYPLNIYELKSIRNKIHSQVEEEFSSK